MPKLKPLAVSALIFLLLIGVAQSVSASDWVEIFEDIDGWLYFVDRDSIQTKSYSSIVSVWVRTEYPDETHDVVLSEFDFSDRTYRWLASYEYDSGGNMIAKDTSPTDWDYIIPDTIAEDIYLYLKDLLNW